MKGFSVKETFKDKVKYHLEIKEIDTNKMISMIESEQIDNKSSENKVTKV